MLNGRSLVTSCALLALCAAGARAESRSANLGRFVPGTPTRSLQAPPTTIDPITYISLRGGAMVSPRGAALVGADVSVPSMRAGDAWHARFDLDFILKANFGGASTVTVLTADLLNYNPNAIASENLYFGGGVGYKWGGNGSLAGKLILGVPLTNRFDIEGNLTFVEDDTILAFLARIHL